MIVDPISDMLSTIRNGQLAKLAVVSTPASKERENVLAVLKKEGFIREYSRKADGKVKARLEIELKYFEGQPAIKEVWRVSKPGNRQYFPVSKLPRVKNGLGISILSTSNGVMSDTEARRANVGGEILCAVF
jgi:small subunit ribosomal protein S8